MTNDKEWLEMAKRETARTIAEDIVLAEYYAYRVPEVLQNLRTLLCHVLVELKAKDAENVDLKARLEAKDAELIDAQKYMNAAEVSVLCKEMIKG